MTADDLPSGPGGLAVPDPELPEYTLETFFNALDRANVRVQLWFCPVQGHSDSRTGANGWPVQTVEWVGDVADCLFPGCDRTSEDPS